MSQNAYRLKSLVRPIDYPWLDRAFGPDTIFYAAPDAKGTIRARGKCLRLSRISGPVYQIPARCLEPIEMPAWA